MKRREPRILLFTLLIFLLATVLEPMNGLANPPEVVDDFEEFFFDEESSLEELSLDEFYDLSDRELENLGVNLSIDDLNDGVLQEDFDFEKAVDEIDVANMNKSEKELFVEIIREQIELAGVEEPELFEDTLLDLYNSESETFNDLKASQEEIEDAYMEKIENEELSFLSKILKNVLGENKVYAAQKRAKIAISTKYTGIALNVVIGAAFGGGLAAIQKFVVKKGLTEARKIMSRVARKKLNSKILLTAATTAITTLIKFTDPGGAIARLADNKDKYPRNGWIDIK